MHCHEGRTNLEIHHLFVFTLTRRPQLKVSFSFVSTLQQPGGQGPRPHGTAHNHTPAPSLPPPSRNTSSSTLHSPPIVRIRRRWRRQPGRCRPGLQGCWPSSSWGWQTTRPKASRCAWGSRTTCPRPWLLCCISVKGWWWRSW